jgi:hypothetical protein
MNLSEIFHEIMASLPARRGSVHEQFIKRLNSRGEEVVNGPYYVYTCSINGKTQSERINKKDYPRIKEECERGRKLADLMNRIWALAESEAKDSKKKRTGADRRSDR